MPAPHGPSPGDPTAATAGRDGAAVLIPPPLLYAAGVAGGYLLQRFVIALPFLLPGPVRIVAAVVSIATGIALMAAAVRLFRATGQQPEPWKPSPEIISGGVYRYTRNPMYVGMALLQIGLGLSFRYTWILLLVPVVLGLVYLTAVRHEEAYLERKFGDTYTAYKTSVRRWI